MAKTKRNPGELSNEQLVALDEIEQGRKFAIDLFGEQVSVEDQFAIGDCIYTETAEDDKADLRRAREIAKKIFGTEAPTAEMVIGVYDRSFGAEEMD